MPMPMESVVAAGRLGHREDVRCLGLESAVDVGRWQWWGYSMESGIPSACRLGEILSEMGAGPNCLSGAGM